MGHLGAKLFEGEVNLLVLLSCDGEGLERLVLGVVPHLVHVEPRGARKGLGSSGQGGYARPLGTMEKRTETFGIELSGLIKLLAKNLYAEHDVFVRELLQNAHDSISRRHAGEGDGKSAGKAAPAGVIRVLIDHAAKVVRFADNGTGLTEQQVREYLSVIGKSGTDAFRKDLADKGRLAGTTLIGQFGIGLLSAFVVADTVEVVTKSATDRALRWVSQGGSTYTIEDAERAEIGTTVSLHITQDKFLDVLHRQTLVKAIRKYADFLQYPIYLDDDTAPTNAVTPPWLRHYASDQERIVQYSLFVAQRFPDHPLCVIPVAIERPYRVQGILYVSDFHIPDYNTTGLVDIYSARMFVTSGHRDVLPKWAKFIRGVIDCPDLTLTAARDNIQHDEVLAAVSEALGRAIVGELTALAKADKARLTQILQWHDYHIKMMAVTEDAFFEAVCDLAPFETNEGPLTLAEYLAKAPLIGGVRHLVYFIERGSATQHYILFGGKGLRVINASGPFEEEFLQKYARLRGVPLHPISVATSTLVFSELLPDEAARLASLEARVARTLHIEGLTAKASSFEPTYIPAVTIFARDERLDREVEGAIQNPVLPEGVRKLLGKIAKDRRAAPVTLFLNAQNPSIQRLIAADIDDDTFGQAVVALYNNALILAQHRITPDNAEIIFRQFAGVIDKLLRTASDLAKARERLASVELLAEAGKPGRPSKTPWVSCFVALPSYGCNEFFEALTLALEAPEVGAQVVRSGQQQGGALEIPREAAALLQRAHCFGVELSREDMLVGMELGRMTAFADRPLVVFHQKGARQFFDLRGAAVVEYPAEVTTAQLAEVLRRELAKVGVWEGLLAEGGKASRYLSAVALGNAGIAEQVVKQVVSRAGAEGVSAEAFVRGSKEELERRWGVPHYLIQALQEHVARVYKLPSPGRT